MNEVELARRLVATHPEVPVIQTTGDRGPAEDETHGVDRVREPCSAERVAGMRMRVASVATGEAHRPMDVT